MKKQLLALFLTFCMLFACVPAPGAAQDAPYRDVSIGNWYFQSVSFCTELGLMNGVGQDCFAPDGSINRAIFVTILHRLAGSPDAAESGFTDVPANSFYAKAVDWAAGEGIVNGTSATTFSPECSILRQDMACILARYLLSIDEEILHGDVCEQAFLDEDLVSGYARESVEIMRRTGLFRCDTASNFRPLDTANRAEASTLFTRLALALEIVPAQAVLETEDGQFTLSVKDTIWLYNYLTCLDWEEGMYAEYVPTHTLILWNGEYHFFLPNGEFHNGINYVCGVAYMGNHQVNPLLMRLIYERFAACIP